MHAVTGAGDHGPGRFGVVAGRRFVAVLAGALYATAGGAALLMTVTPQPSAVQVAPIRAIATLALIIGVGLLGGRAYLPRWAAHPLVLGGVAAVTCAATWGGPTPAGAALAAYFIFVALACGLFFTAPWSWAHLVVTVAACLLTELRQGLASVGAGVVIAATAVVVALGSARVMRSAVSADLGRPSTASSAAE